MDIALYIHKLNFAQFYYFQEEIRIVRRSSVIWKLWRERVIIRLRPMYLENIICGSFWSRVFELSCRFPRRWGEEKKSGFIDRVRRGMIYGKVYGRSIVLARFLIEISSHARHNNFSRTCKHEGRPRVRSIFSTWTWTIILFDRSASISR